MEELTATLIIKISAIPSFLGRGSGKTTLVIILLAGS